jgi:hypothetical protein
MDPLEEMTRLAREPTGEGSDEVTANAIISECENDLAAAVLRLVRVNRYLMRENDRLMRAASPGFMRGSGGQPKMWWAGGGRVDPRRG